MGGLAQVMMLRSFEVASTRDRFHKPREQAFAVTALVVPGFNPGFDVHRKTTFRSGREDDQISLGGLFRRLFGRQLLIQQLERPPAYVELTPRPKPANQLVAECDRAFAGAS